MPGAPLHRAGVVATAKLGRAVDVLANASYTAANNPNRLPAYTVLNAGFAAPLATGSIALIGTNLSNTHAGTFVGYAGALALPRAGAPPLLLPATPLPPRAVALTYTVRAGRTGAAGSGAQRTEAEADGDDAHGGTHVMIRAARMRAGPHPDALQIDPDNDACTPVAARFAQPVMDAIGRIAAAAEKAKTGSVYPAAFPRDTAVVNGITVRYTPFENGSRFVVALSVAPQAGAGLINCAHLSVPQAGDVQTYRVYEPPAPEKGSFFIGYIPEIGLYLLPPADAARGARVEVSFDPEPAAPPADPFTQRAPPACPASSRPLADAMVAAVRSARAGTPRGAADVAEVVPKGDGTHAWLEITVRDSFAQAAVLQCLHVAAVPRGHLQAAGIGDARRPGALGFAERFGFYAVAVPGGRWSARAPPTALLPRGQRGFTSRRLRSRRVLQVDDALGSSYSPGAANCAPSSRRSRPASRRASRRRPPRACDGTRPAWRRVPFGVRLVGLARRRAPGR